MLNYQGHQKVGVFPSISSKHVSKVWIISRHTIAVGSIDAESLQVTLMSSYHCGGLER